MESSHENTPEETKATKAEKSETHTPKDEKSESSIKNEANCTRSKFTHDENGCVSGFTFETHAAGTLPPTLGVKPKSKPFIPDTIRDEFEHRLNGSDEKAPSPMRIYDHVMETLASRKKNQYHKEEEVHRDDDDSFRYDLIYNPQSMIYGSFRKYSLQERIIKVRDLERHYYMRNKFSYYRVDRDVHFGEQKEHKAVIRNGDDYIYRMLNGYECVLFSKLHWNVFDFVHPMKCKYVMMSKYSSIISLVGEFQPFLALCPTLSYPNFVFCCYLDDAKIPVYN